ncbi:MAG: AAA family ATPase, partial [Methylococcales bacterium]|nr:AAA family ATPase [Methylococcales bacterium]
SENFKSLFKAPRTTHFLLKTVEEGISDFDELPPPFKISDNLDLIPGRLTLFMYENKIAERWTGMFLGEPLSIRTVTKIRKLAESYTEKHGYDFVIIDTSPNLGALNKVIISTVDGFIIPCLPDMFSLYGIKNIGKVLTQWQRDFKVCFSIISDEKRKEFPEQSVKFLGHTLYKAKKGSPDGRYDGLAKAHYNYAKEIPTTIKQYIHKDVLGHLSESMIKNSIGDKALMLSHNSLPNMAQKYKKPMWLLPAYDQLEDSDKGTIRSKRNIYEKTREMYEKFAKDFLIRVETLDE